MSPVSIALVLRCVGKETHRLNWLFNLLIQGALHLNGTVCSDADSPTGWWWVRFPRGDVVGAGGLSIPPCQCHWLPIPWDTHTHTHARTHTHTHTHTHNLVTTSVFISMVAGGHPPSGRDSNYTLISSRWLPVTVQWMLPPSTYINVGVHPPNQ